jgi:hypothetical protein
VTKAYCGADMVTKLIHRIAFMALATLLVLPLRAQEPKGTPPPGGRAGPENEEAVSVEQSATFEVRPVSGTLKETVQSGQQLTWRGRGSPGERRFAVTDMSVAFLRNEAPAEVKMTFVANVSALGWRPADEPKLSIIVRTRGGASLYSWTFDISLRCADNNRTLPPLTQQVPNDLAANLFNSAGTVEISEHRDTNAARLMARKCPS